MIRKITTTLLLSFLTFVSYGQNTVSKSVLSAGGESVAITGGSMSYTIGEPVILSGSVSSTYKVTSGFQPSGEPTCDAFIVTSSNDDAGSPQCGELRFAIQQANLNDLDWDTITFNLPANNHVITLEADLPEITASKVLIDGSTQDSYVENTLGANFNGNTPVTLVGSATAGTGLTVDVDEVILRGLTLYGFSNQAIFLSSGDVIEIKGCLIGVDSTGKAVANKNEIGIRVEGVIDLIIGGDLRQDKCIVSGSTRNGIEIYNASEVSIFRTIVGLEGDGSTISSNGSNGIFVTGSDHVHIGDYLLSDRTFGNIISGNIENGIRFENVVNSTVRNNLIGVNTDTTSNIGNGDSGIVLEGVSENDTIGGYGQFQYNIIYANNNGVTLSGSSVVDNLVLANRITQNTGQGILLETGAQNNIVPPSNVSFNSTDSTLSGTSENGAEVQVYADFNDQGRLYLGSALATGPNWSYKLSPQQINKTQLLSLGFLTAIQTDGASTSEFSLPVEIAFCNPLLVTKSTDDFSGTGGACGDLRFALETAIGNGGADTIRFDTLAIGNNNTIDLAAALPQITVDSIYIDGDVNDDNTPDVVFNFSGASLTATDRGIFSTGDYTTIDGLILVNTNANWPIELEDCSYGTIKNNYIGINRDGTASNASNAAFGIKIDGLAPINVVRNTIQNNVIGVVRTGISLEQADSTFILDNQVGVFNGVDFGGTERGIYILNNSKGSLIENNEIAFYDIAGYESGASNDFHAIKGGSIYSNGSGITLNTGNEDIPAPNAPSLLSTTLSGTGAVSLALIQIYADSTNQGQVFIDSVKALADGTWSIILDLSGIPAGLDSLTITQTDIMDNTSEFSVPIFIGTCNPLLVTSSDDDAVCGTLRNAINYLNANGGNDTIRFDLMSITDSTINLTTELPKITADGVVILGDVDGDQTPDVFINTTLTLPEFATIAGLVVRSDNCVINGLMITGKRGGTAIQINGNNNIVEYNYIGIKKDGSILDPTVTSRFGIHIHEAFTTDHVKSNSIHGNVVVNCSSSGSPIPGAIYVQLADNTAITQNTLGEYNGVAHPNAMNGIALQRTDTTQVFGNTIKNSALNGIFIGDEVPRTKIGASSADSANVIGFSGENGILITDNISTNQVIRNNYIGTDASGANLGNTEAGIKFTNDASYSQVYNSTIGFNNEGIVLEPGISSIAPVAILISDCFIGVDASGNNIGNISHGYRTTRGSEETIQSSKVANNGGYGIVYFAQTVKNTHGSSNEIYGNSLGGVHIANEGLPTGNAGILKPVITGFDGTTVSGTYTPPSDVNDDTWFLSIYADDSTQGRLYLGQVTNQSSGTWSFDIPAAKLTEMNSLGLDSLTAIQTDSITPYKETYSSEFSEPFSAVFCNPLLVTSTADDGTCGTLRHAINTANADVTGDPIEITFNPSSFPTGYAHIDLVDSLLITRNDITLEGDFDNDKTPNVILDGNNAIRYGFYLEGVQNTTISGFNIVDISLNDNDLNRSSAVYLRSSSLNVLKNLYIGVDSTGNNAIALLSSILGYGIYLSGGSTNNQIGVPDSGNVIGGAYWAGVFDQTSDINSYKANKIGVGADGISNVGNRIGIHFNASSNTQVGGTLANEKNTISNNSEGITLGVLSAASILMSGNIIYGNVNDGIDFTAVPIENNNGGIDAPIITELSTALEVSGTLSGATYSPLDSVFVFADAEDEGRLLLASVVASPNWSVTIDTLGLGSQGLNFITALLDSTENTSEFSLPIPIEICPDTALTIDGTTSFCASNPTRLSVVNQAGASYQWFLDGIAIAGAIDTIYEVNASSGVYQAQITLGSCVDSTREVVLNVTPDPNFSVATLDPTSCGGLDGELQITDLNNTTSYDVVYYSSGLATENLAITPTNDSIVIGGFSATNTIDSVTVDSAGCSTTFVNLLAFTDPDAPTFTVVTSDPTSCGGVDGELKLAVLDDNFSYTISYDDGSPQTVTRAPVNDTITISGFSSSSSITSIEVDSLNCKAFDSGTYTFTDPDAPTFTVVTSDPTSCGGVDGELKLAVLDDNFSYTISYDDGSPQTVTQVPVNDTITIFGFSSTSTISAIQVDSAGCGTVDIGTYTFSDPLTPIITNMSSENMTTCGNADGEIVISGLDNGTSYNVSYDFDGTPQFPLPLPVVLGELFIPITDGGTYSNFAFENAGCTSRKDTNIVINDPCSNAIVDFTADKLSICAGDTVVFTNTTTEQGAAATYVWDFGINATVISGTDTSSTTVSVRFDLAASETISLEITDEGEVLLEEKVDFVTVLNNPSSIGITQSGNLCTTGSVDLTVTSGLTYQWYVNTTYKLIGKTSNTLEVSVAGTYYVDIDAGSCSGFTAPVTVEYNTDTPPSISILGNSLTATSTISGTYQWYVVLDGEKRAIVGANAATYRPYYNGAYFVSVSNNSCRLMSETGKSVNNPAFIDAAKAGLVLDGNSVTIPTDEFISVFPNPANEDFKLTYYSNEASELNVAVYDLLGDKKMEQEFVKNQAYFEYQFDGVDLPAGMYVVIVNQNNKKTTFKMYIE